MWNDARTEETVEKVLDGIPDRNIDHFKNISGKIRLFDPLRLVLMLKFLFTGLPISPYFSALKIKWLKDNYPEIKAAFEAKTCLVGTIDSWLTWVSFPTDSIENSFQMNQTI